MKENIINQLLAPYIQQFSEYVAPKAHDAIDHLQHKWETSNENSIDINKEIENLPYKDDVLGIIMGLGGGGVRGAGKAISAGKAVKDVPKMFQGGVSFIDNLLSGFSE